MINNAGQTDSNETRRLARVAWMYYIDGMTQQSIGDLLNLSRVKINRLLQQARERGIVEVRIHTPQSIYVELERGLCSQYGLKDALVVTEAEPGEALYRALAQGAAFWLRDMLRADLLVGIGQGRTLSFIPQVFGSEHLIGSQFVEIIGGASSPSADFANYNITSRMAELTGSRASYLHAPTIVTSPEMAAALKQEPPIAAALELARQAEVVLHSVGPVDRSALLYLHGYLSDEDLADLRALGAVGDTLGQFFDESGDCVRHSICKRAVAISLDDLRRIPYSVMVSGGTEKVETLRAALKGRLMNVLITDSRTAGHLLEGA